MCAYVSEYNCIYMYIQLYIYTYFVCIYNVCICMYMYMYIYIYIYVVPAQHDARGGALELLRYQFDVLV